MDVRFLDLQTSNQCDVSAAAAFLCLRAVFAEIVGLRIALPSLNKLWRHALCAQIVLLS